MKRVISFSIWGTNQSYFEGAHANARLAQIYYPDWELWIYCASDIAPDALTALNAAGYRVIVRDIQVSAWEGLFWRFEPATDPEVELFLSRDCDSRINPREQAAVYEWNDSKKTLHTMRDHYEHIVPILGGMWGLRYWPKFLHHLDGWITRNNLGDDQEFLKSKIWPELKEDCVAHDLYVVDTNISTPNGLFTYRPVNFYGEHNLRPFPKHQPLQKEIHGEHVGSRIHV
jgi:hypothetical protein